MRCSDSPSALCTRPVFALRPHVLKVDVEGHDYHVILGFLGYHKKEESDTAFVPILAAHQLPLIVLFEAKSIADDDMVSLRSLLEER